MKINSLININFYLFKRKSFFNKIINLNIKNFYFNCEINLINHYINLKQTLRFYNPFYGIKINTLLEKIKKIFINKKNKINQKLFLIKKYKKYIIPYKDLTYIFNMSIEKLRIKKKYV